MEVSLEAYYAVEVLRFLRRSRKSKPWTRAELSLIVTLDEQMKQVLSSLWRANEKDEDNEAVKMKVRELLERIKKGEAKAPEHRRTIPQVLDSLKKGHYIDIGRRGVWILKKGKNANLLEIIHHFGDEIGIAPCCHREGERFNCPNMKHNKCRAFPFYDAFSGLVRYVLRSTRIEDLALEQWNLQNLTEEFFRMSRK